MEKTITGLKLISAFLPLLAGFCACASTGAQNTEPLLSVAGFRTQTPSPRVQLGMYNRRAPYSLQPNTINGEVLYSYADKKKGVVYIGGEKAYQRYRHLVLQQLMAEKERQERYAKYIDHIDQVESRNL